MLILLIAIASLTAPAFLVFALFIGGDVHIRGGVVTLIIGTVINIALFWASARLLSTSNDRSSTSALRA